MKHTHTFQYDIEGFDSFEAPDAHIKFEIDGAVNLKTLLEHFKVYLIAAGFNIGPTDRLTLVPKDSVLSTKEEFLGLLGKQEIPCQEAAREMECRLRTAVLQSKQESPVQEAADLVSKAPAAQANETSVQDIQTLVSELSKMFLY